MSDRTGLGAAPGSVTTNAASTGRGATPRPVPRLSSTTGLVVKLVLLALVNGLVLYGIQTMIADDKLSWAIPSIIALVVIDIVYLSQRRFIPGKYLLPGTIFLLVFALYPVGYNVYISFTNYGTGNILTQSQAIEQIERNSIQPPSEDAPAYAMRVLQTPDGTIEFFLTDTAGKQFIGTSEALTPADPAKIQKQGELLTGYGDAKALNLREAQDNKDAIAALKVPAGNGTYIASEGFLKARTVQQRLVYDSSNNTMRDTVDGTVYTAQDGAFVSPTGVRLDPGWRTTIGFANYQKLSRQGALRESFTRTFVWTFVFAIGSVITTFAAGLLLAMVFHSDRMRGRRIYRSLIIIPYALPSFMTALVWKGMLNQQFGIINKMLGTNIPWLDGSQGINRIWPYISILLVNLWLGYPYMFLVSTGALQSIPKDLTEAAFVDGATGFKAFRRVTFPLLLTALAPLLISSFAFNFNNFNLIYLLTEGKPPVPGSDIGRTDILISAAYKIAFGGGRGADYGLAAAVSVIIFVVIATISAFSFRFTRTFEEVR